MTWTLSENLHDYVAIAGDFLRSRPVRSTIQLDAAEILRARGASAFGEVAPLFGWWQTSGGEIIAAVLHTPPYPEAGASQVVLFTDLGNPTGNALYQRLGYRPVEDRLVLRFGY
jgi:hypothetical protein